MPPPTDKSPVEAEALARLPDRAISYDLIYTPSPTYFLQLAADRGLQTFDGVEMLVQQGAAGLEIWVQQSPPIATMRQALKDHLGLV
jgi:shikimate dehydrogenase